jgi:putative ABC transport system substrate-binding protein
VRPGVISRRQFVAGAGLGGLGLLAGCGRLPWRLPWPPPDPPPLHRIGYLALGVGPSEAFHEGLREHGWLEGQNIAIEYRIADRDAQFKELAAELVQLNVEVIIARGTPAVRAAKEATTTIPIVMVIAGDPVRTGLVPSIARPDSNITGNSTLAAELSAKRLELLKAVVPDMTRVALLSNPANPLTKLNWEETIGAARALGVEAFALDVQSPDDFESAFEAAKSQRADALITLPDSLITNHPALIASLAARSHVPAMYEWREFPEAGGLMALGPSLPEFYRRTGYYVDRILKGARPADLPIEQPMRFDFVVNLKTARELGITFPDEIMLEVTEVIQ